MPKKKKNIKIEKNFVSDTKQNLKAIGIWSNRLQQASKPFAAKTFKPTEISYKTA